MTGCAQPRCQGEQDPDYGPFCSRACLRLNALVVAPTVRMTAAELARVNRPRRHAAEPTPRPCVPCRHCMRAIMVISARDCVLRVNPEPVQDGNLVINGDHLVAMLSPAQVGRKDWAGQAYREHRCRA